MIPGRAVTKELDAVIARVEDEGFGKTRYDTAAQHCAYESDDIVFEQFFEKSCCASVHGKLNDHRRQDSCGRHASQHAGEQRGKDAADKAVPRPAEQPAEKHRKMHRKEDGACILDAVESYWKDDAESYADGCIGHLLC